MKAAFQPKEMERDADAQLAKIRAKQEKLIRRENELLDIKKQIAQQLKKAV